MFGKSNQDIILDDDSEDSIPSLKIVMLGDSGVGKTSLAQRWSIGIFEPNQRPTIGAFSSLHRVKLNKSIRLSQLNKSILTDRRLEYKFPENDKNDSKSLFFHSNIKNDQNERLDVDVFLWDTAGQEQYAPLSPLFLRESSSVILTVSCIDQISLENAAKWIGLVNQFSEGDPPVILAVNKTDILPSISSLLKSQNFECESNSKSRSFGQSAFTINEIIEKYPSKVNDENLSGYFAAIVPVSAESGFNVNALFQIAAEEGYDYEMNKAEHKNLNNNNIVNKGLGLNSNYSQSTDCC